MTFDENASVRYLMKEMDPSEELLFEKKMMDDDNLLIEVESLRNVHHRLSELPEMDPPSNLTRTILIQASEHHQQKRATAYKTVYLSAAASILVAFLAGAYLIFEPFDSASDGTGATQSAGTGAATFPSLNTFPVLDLNNGESEPISPWVDRNEELHFMDRFNGEHAEAFDSLMQHSLERLQPREDPAGQRSEPTRGLHLTGQP